MNQRKPAADRKTDIIDALFLLADRIGPDRLTTNDVARAVGITQAAVFRHFSSKAVLWTSAGTVLHDRLTRAWDDAIRDTGDPRDRLKALVRAQLDQITACPALPAILHSRELNGDNPELRRIMHGLLMRFHGLLAGCLRDMQARGGLSDRLAPSDGAVFLTSLVQGVAIRWALTGRQFDLCAEGARLLDIQISLMETPG